MLKKLLIAAALLTLCSGVRAENDDIATTTYDGHKDSKVVVMNGLRDGMFTFLSDGNRYLSGNIDNELGFVYDFADQKLLTFYDFVLYAYNAPDRYVAAPIGANALPYFRYNGKDIPLKKTITGSENYDNDISFWNANPTGDRVVMLAYEWDHGYNSLGQWDSVTNPVGALYDAKTGEVITKLHSYWKRKTPLRNEENINYGSRAHAISADGKVLGGWGTWPTDSVLSTWQTTFWDIEDLNNIKTFAIADVRFSMSDLAGANSDGSTLVGYNEQTGHGLIIHYERAKGSFTFDTVSPLPGYGLLSFNTVDDNGRIFGYCGIQADPANRKAVVYTEGGELLDLNTYLYEYYDITVPTDLGCPTVTSLDGSIVSGFYFVGTEKMPWFIHFGQERILPRARNVKAKAKVSNNDISAVISWQAPLTSETPLTAYEIYRNGTYIASVDKNSLAYTDQNCEEGEYTYQVVAVYGNDKAGASTSNQILATTRFPVQQIGHQLQYNRYASVYWGLPSSEVIAAAANKLDAQSGNGVIDRAPATVLTSRTAPASSRHAKQYKNLSLDFIYNVDMLMYNGYCGIKIGDLYYVSSWQGDGIRILDQYNTVVKNWQPAGLSGSVLSMVYLDNKLYCGTEEYVYFIDMDNPDRIEDMFIDKVPSRHMTYIPDLTVKGHKGVLMAGGWEDAKFYDLEGNYLEESGFDFTGLAVSGTAYYDGKVYAASQTGKYQNEIYVFDLASRQQDGDPIQVVEDPAVYDLLSLNGEATSMEDLAVAGGLTTCTLDDGTVALAMGYQCSYVHSQLMFLELESAPERVGYNLYRDGDLIAKNLTSRRYSEELLPGEYKYEVKAIYEDKESAFSPATTVKIEEYGTCLPAKDLKAHETNQWVVLDWDVPTATSESVIGFMVFRDGVKLADLVEENVAIHYNDLSDLEKGATYTYRIESLYTSGCKSADSVKITITDDGEAMAPFGFHIDYKKSPASSADNKLFDVTAQWETPMFEEPMSIGYGGGVLIYYNSFGEDLPKEYWAAIGWDSTGLKLYKDLSLVGMEFMLGDNTKTFEAFVYLNDTLVYTQPENRPRAKDWVTLYFNKSFSMNQPLEVAIGYHITYGAETTPVAIDMSANESRYSDLLSFDGVNYVSLSAYEINASWAIRGLVARKRDLAAATRPDGSINPALLEGKIMRVSEKSSLPVTLASNNTKAVSKPSPKVPLTLQGYNLYRQRMDIVEEEVQLNSGLMKETSYMETSPLPQGEYDYKVEAVYSNTTESATVQITLEDQSTEQELNGMVLTLYPNPASETVYVNGEYAHLQILDLGGRVLRQLPATTQIELNGMTPGTYFFRFTDESGRMATYKVVVK